MENHPTGEAADNTIHVPEPAHVHESYEPAFSPDTDTDTDTDDEELEATELRELSDNARSGMPPVSHVLSPGKPINRWDDKLRRFWRHQIRISVPHDDCRDHLGKLRV